MCDRKWKVSHLLIWAALAMLVLQAGLSADEPPSDETGPNNCRLWGIIAEQAPEAAIQDQLVDLPNSLKNLSPSHTDGWGIGYYVGTDLVPTMLRGYPPAYQDPNFDLAVATVAAATPRVSIAHVRNASTGAIPATGDPHPFERVKNGRHWLFEHNGTVDKNIVLGLIRPDYIATNPPQYGNITTNWADVIDSDLYFLFLLQTLEDFNWQVKPAIGYAIERLRTALPGTDERLNFLLTDGTTIWGYRQGGSSHTLYYVYNTVGTPYSAIASQYPTSTQGDWVFMQSGELVTLRQSTAPVLENIEDYFGEVLVVDNNFDVSATSEELRAAGGWYESRGEAPTLLTLNEAAVGSNGSKKAALAASSSSNAYLSQAFTSAPTSQVSLRWDIYVDNILDGADRDRGALQLVGQDLDGTNGPNSTSSERFVFLAFYALGGAETGTMDLIAREPGDDYATSTAWLTVASGLELDRWYTIQVDCDLSTDTYDVYVNGALRYSGVQAFTAMTQLTHVSFAQWNDGSGAFLVDNVYEGQPLDTRTLTIASSPIAGGTTVPETGTYNYAEGDVVTVMATPAAGYRFDFWTGNVADPSAATTTVVMDDDQTITARFSLLPISFLADNEFDESVDSDALRADGPGQDWYESRADMATLLTLNTDDIGGNASSKAAIAASAVGNVYLSQELGEVQTGVFGVTWSIYVDEILDRSGPDYSGWQMIGDDADGIRGPNSTGIDRFVYLAFEKDGGGTDGTMDLVARAPSDPWDSFTIIAPGLDMDQWYTIGVICDVGSNTYDVFLNGELVRDNMPAFTAKSSLTHISFAQWNDGSGSFYVDDVYHGYMLQMAVDPVGGGTTDPGVGTHLYAEGMDVTLEALPNTGFEFDYWDGNVDNSWSSATSITMYSDEYVTATFEAQETPLVADGYFDASVDSDDLRANAAGQDWYESRGQYPTLLSLDYADVGGNSTNKAAFASSTSYNAYLSQEFLAPQTSMFSLSWNIYVDNIVDNSTGDRAGFQLIGQDLDGTNGPNSTSTERFVFLAFWAEGGATSGTMNLIAREPGDTYNTSSAWALVASDLTMDAWHTIQVVCNLETDTYDVYVDGALARAGVQAYTPMTQVTHISFAQWNDGSGAFFVDDVVEPVAPSYDLTLTVDPPGAGTTTPSIGTHGYPQDEVVTISANPTSGYQFDQWDGDVADPYAMSTTVIMDADKAITANFSPAPVTMIADSYFDIDATSAALRADGPGQDWYESRGANPELLELDATNVAGNITNKARLVGSPAGNVYLSQELGEPQYNRFAVEWDILVEEILDISSPDRTGWMLIGDDTDPNRPGPNSDPAERFVQMAFFRDGGGTFGTMDLVARERGASFTGFTTVATGLDIGQWYTIKVVCDLLSDTYDVYINDVYEATLTSYSEKSSVTHISFGQWNDGAGTFYVDNVMERELPPTYSLTIGVDPPGSADTEPSIGAHDVPVGATISVSALAHTGYAFDYWSGDVVDPYAATTEIVMDSDKIITAHFTEVPIVFLADGAFDDAVDSDDLRADGPGQDWYESRGDLPTLVELSTDPVDGNFGPKALFLASTSNNVYLSQEFGVPQTGQFAVQWEMYVDEILNLSSNPDRTGWMLIGDAANTNRPGPNSDPDERFVQMAFFRDGGGTSGTMDLVARERNASFEDFTTVATGVTMDEWHLIKVVCDIDSDTYSVFVDGVYRATVTSYAVKNEVTHVSFAQWNDGAGSFFIDNVTESSLPLTYTLSIDAAPPGSGTTVPAPGSHDYLEGTLVDIQAVASMGYAFSSWSGDVADPARVATTVLMDGNQFVTANFVERVNEPIVEDFEDGFQLNEQLRLHPDWYYLDRYYGPYVRNRFGVGNGVGLTSSDICFTWITQPFYWNDEDLLSVSLGMDFQTDATGVFERDLAGWIITDVGTHASNILGVQLNNGTSGLTIEGSWENETGASRNPTIASIPALDASSWYRLNVQFSKLAPSSASIAVTLSELDATGAVVGVIAAGSIANTSLLGTDAPAMKYFSAPAAWPCYRNSLGVGNADNAMVEFTVEQASAEYALTINIVGNGSVSAEPNRPLYALGEEVTLTADADDGWFFVGWSGDHVATESPTTLTITGDMTVTATMVQDVTAPTLTCPVAITVECGGSIEPDVTGSPVVIDDYDPAPVVAYVDAPVSADTFVRTWTATDASGNATSCDQAITLEDTTPPVLTCPEAIALDCAASVDPEFTGLPEVTDACDPTPIVAYSDADPIENTFIRTWTATDASGNVDSCQQEITRTDVTPPVVVCPADVAVGCGDPSDPEATGYATATDDCDAAPVVTFTDLSEENIITRTWVATDAAGNESEPCNQLITVEDAAAPVVVCPPDLTIDCAVSPVPENTGYATATDDCDTEPEVSYTDSVEGSTIVRSWVAVDNGGNTSDACVQVITVQDTEAPTIACPSDIAIFNTDPIEPDFTGYPDVTDNCDPAPIVNHADVTAEDLITREWTATDNQGNVSSCMQQITILNRAPEVVCAEDVIVDIGDEIVATVSATDADGDPVIVSVEDLMSFATFDGSHVTALPTCSDAGSYMVRFIATDASLADTCYWSVMINADGISPVVSCPEDIAVANDPGVCGAVVSFEIGATDNCEVAGITATPASGSLFAPGETVVQVTALDATGNEAGCSFTVTVTDAEAPTLTCPADVAVECGTSAEPEITGFAVAVDACDDEPTVGYTDVQDGYVIERTWTAADASGNESTPCVQVITIENCPELSTIYGQVSISGAGVLGVPVALSETDGTPVQTVYSDADGEYSFDGVAVGNYSVEVAPPIGYAAVSDVQVYVFLLDVPIEVNFELASTAGTSSMSHYWWLMEIEKILGIRPGTPVISADNIGGYLQDIHDHFYARSDGYAVEVEEVTFMAGPVRALTFDDLVTYVYFEDPYDGSYEAKVRRSLMTCMLNVAAGYADQNSPVSTDGATMSQAITYFAGLYLGGDAGDMYDASRYLKNIWQNVLIPAGIIPLSTPNVMFKPEGGHELLPRGFALEQNYPNPFNPTTEIRFTLPSAAHATVEIFNIQGQRVSTLVDSRLEAGEHRVIWHATEHASGVYLYRLTSEGNAESKKMLLLK